MSPEPLRVPPPAPIAIPLEALPPDEPDPADVVRQVLDRWRVAPRKARGTRGSAREGLAHRACCVALRRLCPSLTDREIGDAVGIERTTASFHLNAVGLNRPRQDQRRAGGGAAFTGGRA